MKKNEKVFSVDRASDSSGFLLWQVTTVWQNGINKALKSYGLTQPQYVILASTFWLKQFNDEVTQVMISKHAKMNIMVVSDLLATLEKKGMIKRRASKKDSRAKEVILTPKAVALVKKVIPVVEGFDREFFSRLKKELNSFNKNLITLLKPETGN